MATNAGGVEVKVVFGSLPDYEVDVLVNSVGNRLNLQEKALSCKMLDKAGHEMQAECDKSYPNGIKKGDVAVTKGYRLNCQAVYHVSIPHFMANKTYDDHTTEQMLFISIRKCLSLASRSGYTKIAMPTLGVGYCGYPPEIAAEGLCEAVRDFNHDHQGSSLKELHVVIFERDPNGQAFKEEYEKEALRITEVNNLAVPKRSFYKKAPKIPVIIVGIPMRPRSAKAPHRDTKDFLKYMFKREHKTPPYWTQFDRKKTLDEYMTGTILDQVHLVNVDDKTFFEISSLVSSTWLPDHVGHGVDARQLGHSGIEITQIQRVENVILFSAYTMNRQGLFRKTISKGSPLEPLVQVTKRYNNQPPSLIDEYTDQSGVLAQDIYPEVNEGYYFHGTRADCVDGITRNGLDSRLASEKCMHGKGVYFAESSTKADQYADDHSSRSNTGKTMLLSRVCLGEPYISDPWNPFVRAPCKTCFKAECRDHHTFYDSVVTVSGAKLFREFVVYSPQQTYPEYVITYDRI